MEENNKNGVFREKTMERISSADELHDYMRVTSPRLWMLLSVILVLIVGFIVFASLVSMENTIKVQADVNEIDIEAKIPDESFELVKKGMTVRFAGLEGYVESIFDFETLGKGVVIALDESDEKPKIGMYDAEIVLEKISPISFLLN